MIYLAFAVVVLTLLSLVSTEIAKSKNPNVIVTPISLSKVLFWVAITYITYYFFGL